MAGPRRTIAGKEQATMAKQIIRYIVYPVLVIAITAGALSVAYAATDGNIDPQAKWT